MAHRLLLAVLASAVALHAQYSFDHAQSFLKQYCENCHRDNSPAGGFRLSRVAESDSLSADDRKYVQELVRETREKERSRSWD